MELCVRAFVFL